MEATTFFDRDITLENNRVLLRPLQFADVDELSRVAFHPSIWALGMNDITTQSGLQQYIDTAIQERQQNQCYPFVIVDKPTQQVAGSTRFGNISFPHKRLEIGWTWLHPQFHSTGLNKACKFLLLQFAFEQLQFNRVEIKTDVLNHQSRKAILKIGAKEEGIFRKHQITATGRVRDTIYFSITIDEWPMLRDTVFSEIK